MKKNIKNILAIAALGLLTVACSNDDSLNEKSVLPTEDSRLLNEVDTYLFETFTKPYNIDVNYRWDRNIYGDSRDNSRNLYPPKLENVKPAFEMVDHVWIKSYTEVAGEAFVKELRPVQLLAAGGYAYNDDGTRTLGLASGGVQVTLYEVDLLQDQIESAQQFIHTIQHEYIHIINQKQEFNQPEFSARNRGDYTTQWMELPSDLIGNEFRQENGERWDINAYGNILGFVTGYSRSNTIEDFAEVASYLLSTTPEDFQAMLAQIQRYDNMTQAQRNSYGLNEDIYKPGGAAKILYKVGLVKEYFSREFDIDFDELCRVAVRNAADSPMLNRTLGGNSINTFGKKTQMSLDQKKEEIVRFCQHYANDAKKVKSL